MKLKRRIVFIGITLLVLALGFALPSIVAGAQDRIVGNQLVSRSIKAVSLTTSSADDSVAELLEFTLSMSEKYHSEELGIVDEEEEKAAAYQAALELFSLFEEKGARWLEVEKYPEHYEQSLWAAKDGSELKKMWNCILVNESDAVAIDVIIDDTSKKVVSFCIYGMVLDESDLQLLGDTLSDYYGFSESKLTQDGRIQFADASGKILVLSFTQADRTVYFNNSKNVTVDSSVSDGSN